MSDSDSFIQEVTEEVRRDQLFRLMRKYGWIVVLLILVVVGGAAYNEWRKANEQARAEALGDAILAALQQDNSDAVRGALEAIPAQGDTKAVLAMLVSAEALEADDVPGAIAALKPISEDTGISPRYRDLAALKLVLLESDTLTPQQRMDRLEPLAAAGAPYRLLAEEQIALAEQAQGDTEAAIARMRSIIADSDVTAGLRRRVSQLIVALGGTLDPA